MGSAAICIQYIGAVKNVMGIVVSSTSDIVDICSILCASKGAYLDE